MTIYYWPIYSIINLMTILLAYLFNVIVLFQNNVTNGWIVNLGKVSPFSSIIYLQTFLCLDPTLCLDNIILIYFVISFNVILLNLIDHTDAKYLTTIKDFHNIHKQQFVSVECVVCRLALKDCDGYEQLVLWIVWISAFLGIIYQYRFHEQ